LNGPLSSLTQVCHRGNDHINSGLLNSQTADNGWVCNDAVLVRGTINSCHGGLELEPIIRHRPERGSQSARVDVGQKEDGLSAVVHEVKSEAVCHCGRRRKTLCACTGERKFNRFHILAPVSSFNAESTSVHIEVPNRNFSEATCSVLVERASDWTVISALTKLVVKVVRLDARFDEINFSIKHLVESEVVFGAVWPVGDHKAERVIKGFGSVIKGGNHGDFVGEEVCSVIAIHSS